jgi:hypothetical protein
MDENKILDYTYKRVSGGRLSEVSIMDRKRVGNAKGHIERNIKILCDLRVSFVLFVVKKPLIIKIQNKPSIQIFEF